MIDVGAEGAIFTGISITEHEKGNRVYACDFNSAVVRVYGLDWKPVEIDGLGAMLFGNGESLGYRNHFYYAAGPEVENEDIFGELVPLFP